MDVNEIKNWGRSGHLTTEQVAALAVFEETCNKEELELARYTSEHPTECAMRFMRSRKYDAEAAKILLAENIAKLNEGGGPKGKTAFEYGEMEPEVAGDCDVALLKTFYPHTQYGFDKMNRPILWEMDGVLDVNALTCMMSRETLLGYHFWTMETRFDDQFKAASKRPRTQMQGTYYPPGMGAEERIRMENEERGTDSSGLSETRSLSSEGVIWQERGSVDDNNPSSSAPAPNTVFPGLKADDKASDGHKYSKHPICALAVLDLKGMGMAHVTQKCMDQCKLLIGTDNIAYPETLGKMLIINAPYVINIAWNIIKGWLDPRTQNKIEIIGSGETSMAKLREFIDEDQIPKMYGGTGDDLYFPKKNSEFLYVGSTTHSEIFVPEGKAVSVDCYTVDGILEVSISSVASAEDTTGSKNAYVEAEKAGGVVVNHITKSKMDGTEVRCRFLNTFAASDLAGTSTGNGSIVRASFYSSTWSSRPLVYAFTIQDEPKVASKGNIPGAPVLQVSRKGHTIVYI